MKCELCGSNEQVEIASKITGRSASATTRCHRLECGHAWHVTIPTTSSRPSLDPVTELSAPTTCNCTEIVIINNLLVEGKHFESLGDSLSQGAYDLRLEQILKALDGIPAEAGAPSLSRTAATTARSPTTSLVEKTIRLNKLLRRAILAVS